jgi:glycosyltransferase involved in cell wall biosynthesis
MPVFNCAQFLDHAIESILTQTFPDFEFIIINDGSTDDSEKIILKYADARIKYLKNTSNQGLVFSLNRGIDLASGEFIARMDGDDISTPDRFDKQLNYLRAHPEVKLLCTTILLIDESGNSQGVWKDDFDKITPGAIRSFLPINNCIAHPSIITPRFILNKYRYRPEQSQSEDYDLWLRMAAAGEPIHKLKEPKLLHRLVSGSFTRSRQSDVFKKLAITKRRFVQYEWRNGIRNSFVIKTFFFSYIDGIKSTIKRIKRRLKK